MTTDALIENRVRECYRIHEYNCTITVFKILSEIYDITLPEQFYAGAIGMNGAGQYGAQCGLVEGMLIMIGVMEGANGSDKDKIMGLCRKFAESYEKRFGSLLCRELRPEGFGDHVPDHLCEKISIDAVKFMHQFIEREMK